jgi:hypothetical protein
MSDPGPVGRARWKVRLGLAALALLLLLVAGEAVLRRFFPRERPLWGPHPLLGQVQSPDVKRPALGQGGVTFTYETNAFGFRGKAMKTEKAPRGAYRIFFLGDETTLAERLPEEGTFAGLVERTLESRRGNDDPHVESVNAGGPGHDAAILASTMIHRLLPHEPDLVIVTSAWNDMRVAARDPWDEETLSRRSDPPAPSFGDWLSGLSDVANLVREQARGRGLVARAERAPSPTADPKRGLAAYGRSLHAIALACRDAKIELVFATEPSLYKEVPSPEEKRVLVLARGAESLDDARTGLALYNEAMRRAAPHESVKLVDLDALIAKDLTHFVSDRELSAIGHELAAREIVNEVFGDKPAQRRP